ncbi:MAG: hypothetical protein IJI37_05950 [Opitutales bacterium]|nr:hypothetical protein [Opitutales bacterium]
MNKILAIIFSSALLCGAASTAGAMMFSTVAKKENSTFTKCGWESNPHINGVPLKGKPGKRDAVIVNLKYGCKKFTFDASPNIGSLSLFYLGDISIEGKTIALNTGGLHMELYSNTAENLLFTMKKTAATIKGGVTFAIWEKCQSMSAAKLVLIDSKIDATGAFSFTMPALYMKPTRNRSGVTVELNGASYIKCKGELLIDTILAEKPDMHFRFVVNEANGNVPFFSVKEGSFKGTELHINVKSKLRKGVYPVFEFTGVKDFSGNFRGIYFNGKKVSIGTTQSIGGADVTLKIGSADKKKNNDLVLEVK